MPRTSQDRKADKIRNEAYRLGFSKAFENAAGIEAELIRAGLIGVPEALDGMHALLDGLCEAAKRSGAEPGIQGLLVDP